MGILLNFLIRMDFLACELIIPQNPDRGNPNSDIKSDKTHFDLFLNHQRDLIQKVKLVQSYYNLSEPDVTAKLTKEILESILNIKANNYFIFYFGNNQVNMNSAS